jgi:hypothetical protein
MRPRDYCSRFVTIWTICREWTALRCRCCRQCGSNGQTGEILASPPVAAVRSNVRSVPPSMYKDASRATRSPDDIDAIIRSNLARIDHFFITDDNFAGNRNWEAIFDRLIKCARKTDCSSEFSFRSTRSATRSQRLREPALSASSSDSRTSTRRPGWAKKRQIRISEYRDMLLEWKKFGCFTCAGYILGSRPTRRRPSFATSRSSNASCRSIPFPLRLRHQRMCGGDRQACAHRARHLAHGAHRGNVSPSCARSEPLRSRGTKGKNANLGEIGDYRGRETVAPARPIRFALVTLPLVAIATSMPAAAQAPPPVPPVANPVPQGSPIPRILPRSPNVTTNQVGTVNGFTASGFTLEDGANLTVSRTVNGGPSVTVLDSGTLTIGAGVRVTAATIRLTASNIGIAGTALPEPASDRHGRSGQFTQRVGCAVDCLRGGWPRSGCRPRGTVGVQFRRPGRYHRWRKPLRSGTCLLLCRRAIAGSRPRVGHRSRRSWWPPRCGGCERTRAWALPAPCPTLSSPCSTPARDCQPRSRIVLLGDVRGDRRGRRACARNRGPQRFVAAARGSISSADN